MPDRFFDGETIAPVEPPRLTRQYDRVWWVMTHYSWLSLSEIASRSRVIFGSHDTEAAISARLRDFRKKRNGEHAVETKRRPDGLWLYRLVPNEEPRNEGLFQ